jgi:hypothetical protein
MDGDGPIHREEAKRRAVGKLAKRAFRVGGLCGCGLHRSSKSTEQRWLGRSSDGWKSASSLSRFRVACRLIFFVVRCKFPSATEAALLVALSSRGTKEGESSAPSTRDRDAGQPSPRPVPSSRTAHLPRRHWLHLTGPRPRSAPSFPLDRGRGAPWRARREPIRLRHRPSPKHVPDR